MSGAVTPVANLDAVRVDYGGTQALSDVTLAVAPGSVYALLGRNGSGKSTAIACLTGLLRPRRGSARLFGTDVWRSRAQLLRRVGVVPEEPDAPPGMTARELGAFSAGLYARWDGAGFEARLGRFEVPLARPFATLSKGQKGQVMLALALGHAPELLILDDPTLGLDLVARRHVFDELIGELSDRGTSVLLATHDLAGIEGIATHVGLLAAGRLTVDEPLERLKERCRGLRFTLADGAGEPELAPLAPVGLRRWPWGYETTLTAWSEPAFAELARRPGLASIEASPLRLEQIVGALAASQEEPA